MSIKRRAFNIIDIDCITIVEVSSNKKEIFSWMDEHIENMMGGWDYADDDSYEILYNDGTYDYVDCCYDGHKIKRNNIKSMVFNNAETSIVFGPFEINEYGVVTVSEEEKISKENIEEVYNYTF